MKLLYYLPAIGNPDINKKLLILDNNLRYIYNNIKIKFSIILNCYDNFLKIKEFIYKYNFLDEIYIYNKKGILTELWLTNPHNLIIKNYDYLLFILDDILIQNIDIYNLIKIKKKYDLRILSPKVINSTYRYMNSYDKLTINNALEIYFLLLTPNDFDLYSSINSIENKTMWGSDLLFGHLNIKVGVYHKESVIHMLPSRSDSRLAYKLGDAHVKKYGFNSVDELEHSIQFVKEIIDVD